MKTHFVSLPHVTVQDPSHALDSGVFQFVGPPHVIIDASAQQEERTSNERMDKHMDKGILRQYYIDIYLDTYCTQALCPVQLDCSSATNC